MENRFIDKTNNFNIYEDETAIVFWKGIVCFENAEKGNGIGKAILKYLNMILEEKFDFNRIYGFYKIAIWEKASKEWVFFGDNSGSQLFFFDTEKLFFAESFLAIKNSRNAIKPNFRAIAEMFSGVGLYSRESLIENVFVTDANNYYIVRENAIVTKEKKLWRLSQIKYRLTYDELMRWYLEQMEGEKVSAVCTGGTDSRVVLGSLVHYNKEMELVLTGHDNNPDIMIARRVAEKCKKELTVVSPDVEDEDWLIKGFEFGDGNYDAVLSYRHYKKFLWAKQNSYRTEFGGVGGEFYKNNYCNFFRYKLSKKTSLRKIENIYIQSNLKKQYWMGENVSREIVKSKEKNLIGYLTDENETLLCKCNEVGGYLLRGKYSVITNAFSINGVTKIDPLMERDVIAVASSDSALEHVMSKWQRKMIYKYAPNLCDIPTDQGYSCTVKMGKYLVECLKKLLFWASRAYARLKKKIGISYKSSESNYWDDDYEKARRTEIFIQAFEVCKALKIVSSELSVEDIPTKQVGNILVLGMLYGEL